MPQNTDSIANKSKDTGQSLPTVPLNGLPPRPQHPQSRPLPARPTQIVVYSEDQNFDDDKVAEHKVTEQTQLPRNGPPPWLKARPASDRQTQRFDQNLTSESDGSTSRPRSMPYALRFYPGECGKLMSQLRYAATRPSGAKDEKRS
jgi:hypothetical protein